MSFLSNLFGFKSLDYKFLMQNGAMIVDVRTPQEFNGGHIKGSVNIPLQSLQSSLEKIPKNRILSFKATD